ncbi:Zinc metalloproteinase-disintegrin-like EoVMP2 [Halotydeus destructor]|nr:Zinc metalloproteinase-disintegrin-like EoVMP2 [Halotydeus destructor]
MTISQISPGILSHQERHRKRICGNKGTYSYLDEPSRQISLDHPIRYVEISAVGDHELYTKYFNSNKKLLLDYIVKILTLVNEMLATLNLHVVLSRTDVWTDKQRIGNMLYLDDYFSNVTDYQTKHYWLKHAYDAILFITGNYYKAPPNEELVMGIAWTESVCSHIPVMVAMFPDSEHSSSYTARQFAMTVAHELGHIVGMEHDALNCSCPEKFCMMKAEEFKSDTAGWTDCSRIAYETVALKRRPRCYARPKRASRHAICGNGVVEVRITSSQQGIHRKRICGNKETYSYEEEPSRQISLDHPIRYVEMSVVGDHELYTKYFQSNAKSLLDYIVEIVTLTNKMIATLNLHIVLSHTDVWTDRQRIGNMADMLDYHYNVTDYQTKNYIRKYAYDTILFITGNYFAAPPNESLTIGQAWRETVCTNIPVMVAMYPDSENASRWTAPELAMTVTHELGHIVGMKHNEPNCSCPEKHCVMEAEEFQSDIADWTDCSRLKYETVALQKACPVLRPTQEGGTSCNMWQWRR